MEETSYKKPLGAPEHNLLVIIKHRCKKLVYKKLLDAPEPN